MIKVLTTLFLMTLVKAPFYECTITVTNIKNTGTLYMGWYNKADGFMQKNKAVYYQKKEVKPNDVVNFTFSKIKAGTYAISILLDENADENLSTNILGIPTEQYGFSNNVYPTFRPASFDEASFVVKQNTNISIRLK